MLRDRLPSLLSARSAAARWLLAVATAVLAMLARTTVDPLLGDSIPFVFAFPATVLAALLWGAGPALAAGLVCLLWVLLPQLPVDVGRPALSVQIGTFSVSTIVTVLICSAFRREPEPTSATAGLAVEDTGLTRWLLAAVWGAALLPATIFVTIAWWGYERAFVDAHGTAERAGDVVRAHAERAFQAAEAIAGKASIVARGGRALADDDVGDRLKDLVLGSSGVDAVTVWAADGSLVASSRDVPASLRTVADSDGFASARDSGARVQVTGVLDGRFSNERSFDVVVRRETPDGRFDGVVAVALASATFQNFYQSLAAEEPGLTTFSLFTTDGALLARWPASSTSTTRVPAKSTVLARARDGATREVLFVRSAFDPERRLFSLQRVGERPVYVTSALSEAYILSTWHRFMELLGAILAPITAVLVYVSWVALKKSREQAVMVAHLREEHEKRRRAEAGLMQNQKLEALSLLTGGVAHDFNNLLAIVANNLHVHRRLHPDLADSPAMVAMERAVSSGVKLTKQLLSFSRRQPVRPETVSLQQWLPKVATLVETTVGRAVELAIEVQPGTWPIFVDTSELELALINLAANARDAMPDGGRLSIAAANGQGADDGQVRIAVSDTGTGIAPEALAKVFEPFFTTKGAGQGSGLGLSQVYGFCRHAGGSVDVASTPGVGTTVTIRLPRAVSAVNELKPSQSPSDVRLAGRVLLVEDNDELAAAMESLFTTAGATVRRTASADAAQAALMDDDEAFDVVVADIALPGSLNGLQLAEYVRRLSASIPVVLVTGYPARWKEATDRGFDAIAKPADPDVLLATVHRLLVTPRPSPPASGTGEDDAT